MTRTEEQLSELLHQAADGLAGGVSFEAVARRARTRRLLAAAASAIAVAALTAGAVVAGAALTRRGQGPAAPAESPRPARARALLSQLSVRPRPGLAVPQDASSVFIQSLAGRDRDHQGRNATIPGASDVRRVLVALRSLRPAESPHAACDGSWWPDTALLTVHASDGPARTYAAQFGRCGQVIAGTGTAATVSGHLLADMKRLVPNSGL